MVQLFTLLAFVAIALVSALYVVEGTWQDDKTDRATRAPVCDDFYDLGGSWNDWAKLLFIVLNAVVDGRAQDALFLCVLHEANENRYLMWLFTYLFHCFVIVLLVNMLIAMFSRSFDLMYDSMTIHVQTHFARAVVAWCASPPEPPPLNLLQLPYQALHLPLSLLHSLFSGGPRTCPPTELHHAKATAIKAPSAVGVTVAAEVSATAASTTFAATPTPAPAAASWLTNNCSTPSTASDTHAATDTTGGSTPSFNVLHSSPATLYRASSFEGGLGGVLRRTQGTFSGMTLQHALHWLLRAEGGGGQGESWEYEGTTVGLAGYAHNSWESWKERMSDQELAGTLFDFVAKREDSLSHEDCWRNKMMSRIGSKFEHVNARLDQMSKHLQHLASVCVEISENARSEQPQQTVVPNRGQCPK
mmetsp:Transcript_15337/g.25595  ORF Transcript_15337/g.25595 Transcript_15337/m.25595 type:complete len:417 (+) Transcript_15337:1-1251(+)